MNNLEEIEKLWLEFYKLPFPSGLAGEDVNGICVTSLDTFTAGCIDTFVSKKGRLDKKRKAILIECQNQLEIVVDNLADEPKVYYEKLLTLTNKILNHK